MGNTINLINYTATIDKNVNYSGILHDNGYLVATNGMLLIRVVDPNPNPEKNGKVFFLNLEHAKKNGKYQSWYSKEMIDEVLNKPLDYVKFPNYKSVIPNSFENEIKIPNIKRYIEVSDFAYYMNKINFEDVGELGIFLVSEENHISFKPEVFKKTLVAMEYIGTQIIKYNDYSRPIYSQNSKGEFILTMPYYLEVSVNPEKMMVGDEPLDVYFENRKKRFETFKKNAKDKELKKINKNEELFAKAEKLVFELYGKEFKKEEKINNNPYFEIYSFLEKFLPKYKYGSLNCIHHKDGFLIASDAHILVKIKDHIEDKQKDGKSYIPSIKYGVKTKIIDNLSEDDKDKFVNQPYEVIYPNYEKEIKKYTSLETGEFQYNNKFDLLLSYSDSLERINSMTTDYFGKYIRIRVGNLYFELSSLKKFLVAIKHIETQKIDFSIDTRNPFLYARNESDEFVLVMGCVLLEDENFTFVDLRNNSVGYVKNGIVEKEDIPIEDYTEGLKKPIEKLIDKEFSLKNQTSIKNELSKLSDISKKISNFQDSTTKNLSLAKARAKAIIIRQRQRARNGMKGLFGEY